MHVIIEGTVEILRLISCALDERTSNITICAPLSTGRYDSYVSQFLISQSKQFPDQSYPFFLVFRGVDYADPASREEMTKLQQQLQSLVSSLIVTTKAARQAAQLKHFLCSAGSAPQLDQLGRCLRTLGLFRQLG
eukprot:SAG31_NODE_123_length_23712_cov_41.426291_10_plen_135_part_00